MGIKHVMTSATMVVLCWLLLICRDIYSRGRPEDTFMNKRVICMIAAYVLTTTMVENFGEPYIQITRFRLHVSICLMCIVFILIILTKRILMLLTWSRQGGELTGIKQMVTSFSLPFSCQLCLLTRWCEELAVIHNNCVILSWNSYLLLLLSMLALLSSVEYSYTSRKWKEVVSFFLIK